MGKDVYVREHETVLGCRSSFFEIKRSRVLYRKKFKRSSLVCLDEYLSMHREDGSGLISDPCNLETQTKVSINDVSHAVVA